MKPVCELEDFHVNKLNVEGVDIEKSNEISVAMSFDYELAFKTDNPLIIKISMKYEVGPNPEDEKPRCPYKINAEITGIFTISEEAPKEQMPFISRVNTLTILYGILRGEVANVTGSFQNGKFILPTVMMQDVVKEVEALKTKARAEKLVEAVAEKK